MTEDPRPYTAIAVGSGNLATGPAADLLTGVHLVAIEGNFGAGKSKYIEEQLMPLGAIMVLEFALPTFLLDSEKLGQAIYPLHDLLRVGAYRQREEPSVIERYIVSTLAFHYAAQTDLAGQLEYLYRHPLAYHVLPMPDSTIIVRRPVGECFEVVKARNWDYSLRLLTRYDELLSGAIPPDRVRTLYYID